MQRINGENVLWFVIGLSTGIAFGLLGAPDSGAETRRYLAANGRDYLDRGRGLYGKGRDLADEAAQLFEDGRQLMSDAGPSDAKA